MKKGCTKFLSSFESLKKFSRKKKNLILSERNNEIIDRRDADS